MSRTSCLRRTFPYASLLVLLAGCAPGGAEQEAPEAEHSSGHHSGGQNAGSTISASAEGAETACEEISIDCGNTPSLTFHADGRLWAVFEKNGHAWVTRSDDVGASFSPPVQINAEAERIETNGEGRPKVALGGEGEVYISWTKVTGRFEGDIRFTRSLDGGESFEPPVTVNDDEGDIGQRFETLFVDNRGDVYLAWIDKRDREAAEARGEEYRATSLYYTVSTDGGATFVPNRRVEHHACECCRIAAAPDPDGGVAVLWRHVFEPSIRDHAFAVLAADGVSTPMRRVSHEGWDLEACPHHGPAIVPAETSGYHMTWFTAAGKRPTIYYGLLDPRSGETRHLREVVSGTPAVHADITIAGDRVILVWKQAGRASTDIVAIISTDGGRSWSEPSVLASTDGGSDHPFLLARADQAWLAWLTAAEGLRLTPV